MKQTKNYIIFLDDHSGSMHGLAAAALKDSNENIRVIKEAATREEQDTIVSRFNFGGHVTKDVVISNPHVLKPATHWPCSGSTPLNTAIIEMVEMVRNLPDANAEHVSILVLMTTDGGDTDSYNRALAASILKELQKDERWTFVFRVPRGHKSTLAYLGIPEGNIQEWDTTVRGMQTVSAQTSQAVDNYFKGRSSGLRGSNTFFSNASNVDVTELDKVDPKKVSLYVVPDFDPVVDGNLWMRDFILQHRMEYLKGSAFYQLTKTEPRVQHNKKVIIRDRKTGVMYTGNKARDMIGLPRDRNARLHPGDHSNYDIFIQSSSINRHLVPKTGVLYWADIGTQFTQEELDKFTKEPEAKRVPKEPVVVALPAVAPTNRPTASPLPTTKRTVYFASRDDARRSGKKYRDNGSNADKGKRWEQV